MLQLQLEVSIEYGQVRVLGLHVAETLGGTPPAWPSLRRLFIPPPHATEPGHLMGVLGSVARLLLACAPPLRSRRCVAFVSDVVPWSWRVPERICIRAEETSVEGSDAYNVDFYVGGCLCVSAGETPWTPAAPPPRVVLRGVGTREVAMKIRSCWVHPAIERPVAARKGGAALVALEAVVACLEGANSTDGAIGGCVHVHGTTSCLAPETYPARLALLGERVTEPPLRVFLVRLAPLPNDWEGSACLQETP